MTSSLGQTRVLLSPESTTIYWRLKYRLELFPSNPCLRSTRSIGGDYNHQVLCFFFGLKDLLLLLGGLLGQQHRVNVWQDTSRGDGDLAQQLAQLFVVAHSQLDVAGHDPGLLVVTGSVAGQLQDLSREVLQDCSQVDWGACPDSCGVLALLQVPCDTAHRELHTAG
jgi:hypothetical protein